MFYLSRWQTGWLGPQLHTLHKFNFMHFMFCVCFWVSKRVIFFARNHLNLNLITMAWFVINTIKRASNSVGSSWYVPQHGGSICLVVVARKFLNWNPLLKYLILIPSHGPKQLELEALIMRMKMNGNIFILHRYETSLTP